MCRRNKAGFPFFGHRIPSSLGKEFFLGARAANTESHGIVELCILLRWNTKRKFVNVHAAYWNSANIFDGLYSYCEQFKHIYTRKLLEESGGMLRRREAVHYLRTIHVCFQVCEVNPNICTFNNTRVFNMMFGDRFPSLKSTSASFIFTYKKPLQTTDSVILIW